MLGILLKCRFSLSESEGYLGFCILKSSHVAEFSISLVCSLWHLCNVCKCLGRLPVPQNTLRGAKIQSISLYNVIHDTLVLQDTPRQKCSLNKETVSGLQAIARSWRNHNTLSYNKLKVVPITQHMATVLSSQNIFQLLTCQGIGTV